MPESSQRLHAVMRHVWRGAAHERWQSHRGVAMVVATARFNATAFSKSKALPVTGLVPRGGLMVIGGCSCRAAACCVL